MTRTPAEVASAIARRLGRADRAIVALGVVPPSKLEALYAAIDAVGVDAAGSIRAADPDDAALLRLNRERDTLLRTTRLILITGHDRAELARIRTRVVDLASAADVAFEIEGPTELRPVFLSYAHRDVVWKDRIAASLRAAGLEVIDGGADSAVVEGTLTRAGAAVLVATPSYAASRQESMEDVVLARRRAEGLPVYAALVEPCEVPAGAQVWPADGRALSTTRRARQDISLSRLATAIREGLGGPGGDPVQVDLPPTLTTAAVDPGVENERLDTAWRDGRRVVVLHGGHGSGKTARVRGWLASMRAAGWRGARVVYGWTFDQSGFPGAEFSEGAFLDDVARAFGLVVGPEDTPIAKGRALAMAMRRQRTLLVLDGAEGLLTADGSAFAAIGLAAMFRVLTRDAGESMVVLTTRRAAEMPELAPVRIETGEGVAEVCEKVDDSARFDALVREAAALPEGPDRDELWVRAVQHGCRAGRVGEALQLVNSAIQSADAGEEWKLRALGAFVADRWRRTVPGVEPIDQRALLQRAGLLLAGVPQLVLARDCLQAVLRSGRADVDDAVLLGLRARVALDLGEIQVAVQHLAIQRASAPMVFAVLGRSVLDEAAVAHGAPVSLDFSGPLNHDIGTDHYELGPLGVAEIALARAEAAAASSRAVAPRPLLAEARGALARMVAELGPEFTPPVWSVCLRARLAVCEHILVHAPLTPEAADRAVANARLRHLDRNVPPALLARAWTRHLLGDVEGAREDLDESEDICVLGGMRLLLADTHLYRARLFHDRAALARARELAEACGYGRRLPEIAEAEAERWD